MGKNRGCVKHPYRSYHAYTRGGQWLAFVYHSRRGVLRRGECTDPHSTKHPTSVSGVELSVSTADVMYRSHR